MRKTGTVLLLTMGLIAMMLSGCGKTVKYHVDYCGQRSSYKGAADSYAAGKQVTLYYTLVATDTSYSFTLDGQPLNYSYDSDKGFIITFVMPDHDVTLSCEQENDSVYEPDPEEEPALSCHGILPEDTDGVVYLYVMDLDADGELFFRINNNTDETFEYGLSYSLEKLEGDAWTELEPEDPLVFTEIAHELEPGKMIIHSADLSVYGTLTEGRYRLTCSSSLNPLTGEFDLSQE